MAKISDLALKYRVFMRTYRYRSVSWEPGASITKPLKVSKIGLITTAGYYRPDQPAFDDSIKGGDFSYRSIPVDTELQSLHIGHRSAAFNHSGIENDKNLALPLDRIKELQAEGFIGDVNQRHFSFMGSITAPGRLISKTAPEVAELLREDRVDAVVLTPV
jgi:D-proline reductase (dithiol) PrdB